MNVVPATITPTSKDEPWSYSKLKNFETCARRFSETERKKAFKEDKTQELQRGDDLHAAMYSRVMSGTALPAQFIYMESAAQRLTREHHYTQIIQCELKLAIDRQYKPVGFFDRNVWLRGKADYFCLVPSEKVPGKDIGHIVDYKTGKPRDDYTQLALNAFLVFAHYKNLIKVRTEFLWTEYNDTMHEMFSVTDMPEIIGEVLPRVHRLQEAIRTNVFPPRPCGLCKDYCPVSSCEHWGKRPARQ